MVEWSSGYKNKVKDEGYRVKGKTKTEYWLNGLLEKSFK